MRPKLELDLDRTGHGTVKLNGHELPFTTAVKVEARVSEPTKVTLELVAADIVISTRGISLDAYTVEALDEIVKAFNEESDLAVARVE